jgi:hypothetical protein
VRRFRKTAIKVVLLSLLCSLTQNTVSGQEQAQVPGAVQQMMRGAGSFSQITQADLEKVLQKYPTPPAAPIFQGSETKVMFRGNAKFGGQTCILSKDPSNVIANWYLKRLKQDGWEEVKSTCTGTAFQITAQKGEAGHEQKWCCSVAIGNQAHANTFSSVNIDISPNWK